MVTTPLLSDAELEGCAVVANNAMNRERGLSGVNSYAKDLGLDVLAFLRERIQANSAVSWLDLCCGTGRALIQAAGQQIRGLRMTGVDLVDYFDDHRDLPGLTLATASVASWQTDEDFDLITCVHGLHYVGDKLGVLVRALSWLAPQGFFAAHLDWNNIRIHGPANLAAVRNTLSRNGVDYHPRRHLLTCEGPKTLDLPLRYLGADASAGANFTGQPAVDSHYEQEKNAV
jgi:SAM-dependent methyltransferase